MRLRLITILFLVWIPTTELFAQASISARTSKAVYCNPPASVVAMVTSNFTCTHPFSLTYHWGDQTSDTIFYPNGLSCIMYAYQPHEYQQAGTYQIRVDYQDTSGLYDTAYTDHFTVADSCSFFSGNVYLDGDQDCTKIFLEPTVPLAKVTLFNTSNQPVSYAFTDHTGAYNMIAPYGHDSLSLALDVNGFEMRCTQNFQPFSPDSINWPVRIPVECEEAVSHHLTRLVGAVAPPGQQGRIRFGINPYYAATCTRTLPDSAMIILDPNVEVINAPSFGGADAIVTDTVIWDLRDDSTSLSNQAQELTVRILTDTSATLFDMTYFTGLLIFNQNGQRIVDTMHIARVIGGPYDPNNKEVSPQGIGEDGIIPPSTRTLTYTINFQNTGNAPATRVIVRDTLPVELDWNSLMVLGSKHEMDTYLRPDGTVKFEFLDIHLPDSSVSQEDSKGWLSFQIDLKPNLPLQTRVKNRVGIYFDYNPPIITNYAVNTIDTLAGSLLIELKGNPIRCDSGYATLTTKIIKGNQPYAYSWNNGSTQSQLQVWDTGFYVVTITDHADSVRTASYHVTRIPNEKQPSIGSITAPENPQSWVAYTYSVEAEPNHWFNWTAEGGEVTEQRANVAKVLWYAGPEGFLKVAKWDTSNCYVEKRFDIDSILFLGIDDEESSQYTIYPNPVSDQLNVISVNGIEQATFNILDLNGRLLEEGVIREGETQISVGDLTSGIYHLHIISNQRELFNTKFSIVR